MLAGMICHFNFLKMNNFEKARLKYKTSTIKYLLIAETPPKSDFNRFFYFENVKDQDSLFLETMKVLYPEKTKNVVTKTIRKDRKEFLERFKNDGFYLIDSLEFPFEEDYTPSQKVKLIITGQNDLLEKIRKQCTKTTKVILIAATFYKANDKFLRTNGVNIINQESIDFPGSGGQRKYREKMKRILSH